MRKETRAALESWRDDLEARRLAAMPNGEGRTVAELCKTWVMGEKKVRQLLHVADDAGLLRRSKKPKPKLNGVVQMFDAYTILPAKKGKR